MREPSLRWFTLLRFQYRVTLQYSNSVPQKWFHNIFLSCFSLFYLCCLLFVYIWFIPSIWFILIGVVLFFFHCLLRFAFRINLGGSSKVKLEYIFYSVLIAVQLCQFAFIQLSLHVPVGQLGQVKLQQVLGSVWIALVVAVVQLCQVRISYFRFTVQCSCVQWFQFIKLTMVGNVLCLTKMYLNFNIVLSLAIGLLRTDYKRRNSKSFSYFYIPQYSFSQSISTFCSFFFTFNFPVHRSCVGWFQFSYVKIKLV